MPRALSVSPPLRVLLTTDAVGGVWRHAVDLAAGLAGAGASVILVTLGPRPAADQVAEAAAIPGVELVATSLPLDWTAEDAGTLTAAATEVARLALETGADLVQLHTAALAMAPFAMPVVAVHHSCVATWWQAMRDGPLPADFAWRTALVGEGLARVDRVVAPSRSFASTIEAVYSLPRPPCVVLNGTAPHPGPPPAGRSRHVLTAGRLWDEAKGAAALDAAAAGLGVPVLAAGPLEGPGVAAFAPRRIRPLGRLDAVSMRRALAEAGAFVSLARYEPFGLGVLEAAAAGCPLVLSDIPTFRELWDGAALFVDPDEAAEVRAAIHEALDDPARSGRLSRAARLRASEYPAETVTRRFIDLYGATLRSPRRSGALLEASA